MLKFIIEKQQISYLIYIPYGLRFTYIYVIVLVHSTFRVQIKDGHSASTSGDVSPCTGKFYE